MPNKLFSKFINLTENKWNGSHLTYDNHYIAHSILVEASKYDNVWGVGIGIRDPFIKDTTKWKGLNLLGMALMEVRTKLTIN